MLLVAAANPARSWVAVEELLVVVGNKLGFATSLFVVAIVCCLCRTFGRSFDGNVLAGCGILNGSVFCIFGLVGLGRSGIQSSSSEYDRSFSLSSSDSSGITNLALFVAILLNKFLPLR